MASINSCQNSRIQHRIFSIYLQLAAAQVALIGLFCYPDIFLVRSSVVSLSIEGLRYSKNEICFQDFVGVPFDIQSNVMPVKINVHSYISTPFNI